MNHVPCPGRIYVDLGDSFLTGCAVGSLWYLAKGAYYSVRRERLKCGLILLRTRAPILAGSFAMWGFIFSITCCGMVSIRQREDPINSIVGGFSTGFILAIRGGFRSAFRNGMIGGLLLGIMEMIMVFQQQMFKGSQLAEEKKIMDQQIKEFERIYVEREDHTPKTLYKDLTETNDNQIFSNAPATSRL